MDSPPLIPVVETPAATPPAPVEVPLSRRPAQVALALLLVSLVGLLAYRGYSHRLLVRPTEPAGPSTMKVDLNDSERGELEQVPGIGPKLARAIDEHRRDRGPFRSVDELRTVHGVGPATLDKLRPFLRVSERPPAEPVEPAEPLVLSRKPVAVPAPPVPNAGWSPSTIPKITPGEPPINVNTAGIEDLQRLPAIGPVLAHKIAETRATASFVTVDDLRKVKGIGAKTLEKLRPFVVVKGTGRE